MRTLEIGALVAFWAAAFTAAARVHLRRLRDRRRRCELPPLYLPKENGDGQRQ